MAKLELGEGLDVRDRERNQGRDGEATRVL
jgi:hypothetical protein